MPIAAAQVKYRGSQGKFLVSPGFNRAQQGAKIRQPFQVIP